MDKIKVIRKNGVTYYLRPYNTIHTGLCCYGIEVADWVTTVRFDNSIFDEIYVTKKHEGTTKPEVIQDVKKGFKKYTKGIVEIKIQEMTDGRKFKNVRKLIIGESIKKIVIENEMFPNVRCIESHSENFYSGSMLMERTYPSGGELLNSFCLGPDEPLDLDKVVYIWKEGALRGCQSQEIKNAENLLTANAETFRNSLIKTTDRIRECGVTMMGPIIVDATYEPKGKTYIMPEYTAAICQNIAFNPDTTMVVQNNNTFLRYMIYGAVVKNVFFEDTSHISLADIENMRGINIEFSKKNPEYSSKDGLVYSKDMKMLISCSHSKSGKVVIADGVEEIRANAFAYRDMIESVHIPDSVERIGANAFTNCDNLKSVVFGNSIKSIGAFAFYCCSNLRQVEFPNSLKRIEAHAFDACNELRHLKLNKGLEYIGTGAFDGGKIRHAKLPSNTKVSKGSLSGVQRVELPDERIPGNITSAIIGGYPQLFDDMKNIPLRMDTATDDGLVYCLKTPTRKIVIPVTLKCSENKRRRFQAESRKLVNGEPHNFFKCCSTLQQQIAIAYMEYENQPTEESRKFLKGYGKELTKVMLEQHMEKELTDLIRKDLFSCVMLEEMYCISSDMGANVVSAYIMNKLACEDKKELNFAI